MTLSHEGDAGPWNKTLIFAALAFALAPVTAFSQAAGTVSLPTGVGVNTPYTVSTAVNNALTHKVDTVNGSLTNPAINGSAVTVTIPQAAINAAWAGAGFGYTSAPSVATLMASLSASPQALTVNSLSAGSGAISGGAISGTTVNLSSPGVSLTALNGTSIGLFYSYPALNWELATGTTGSPITTAGPSFKVSRTENIATSTCSGVFNDNSCNSAIYGATQNNSSSAQMQINGVLGTALTYSTQATGEAVGIQGMARAVGVATAGVAGGYFEGRYDSTAARSYYYTVGIEARSNNLSGTDAIQDVSGGNSYNAVLGDCGDGTPEGSGGAQKCNAAFIAVANASQFLNGFVVASGSGSNPSAVTGTGFIDASNDYAAFGVNSGSTHTYQFQGESFSVFGDGYVWIGGSPNTATNTALNVIQAGSNQAYFASTGANPMYVNLDNQAGGNSDVIQFADAGAAKWAVAKSSSNAFQIYDSVNSAVPFQVTSGGVTTVGEANKGVVANTFYRPQLTTVGNLSTADPSPQVGDMISVSDTTGCTANSTVTGGGSTTCALVYSGAAWKALVTH